MISTYSTLIYTGIPIQVPKSSLFFRILVGGSPTSREAASGLDLLLVSASLWDDPYQPPHPGNHRCRIPPCSVAGGVVTFSGSGTCKKPHNLSSFTSSENFSVQNNYAYTWIMISHISLFMILTKLKIINFLVFNRFFSFPSMDKNKIKGLYW